MLMKHGKNYINNSEKIDKSKFYTLDEGLDILYSFKQAEFDETIDDFLRRESPARAFETERGFYTQKARQLDGGRLEQVSSLLAQIQNEIVETRPDFGITERDLWVKPPAEASA